MGWENFLDRRNKMLLAPLIMLLTGCSVNTWYNPVSPPPSRVSSADMSNRSEEFRRGHKDGCRTAHGDIPKTAKASGMSRSIMTDGSPAEAPVNIIDRQKDRP